MGSDYILAIDNGTQSVRALLFDLEGNLRAKSRIIIEPYVSSKPGWAEQDPEYYWEKICQACRQLWTLTDIPPQAVAGVALTTQRSTLVNVDDQGKPLRPAIVWLDQRRTEDLTPIGGLWGLAFKISGNSDTIAYLQAEAEGRWIATYQPHIWEKTYKYLFLSGYLTYRLTGRYADSIGAQVGYVPFDYKHHRWAARWNWKWKIVPVEPSMLPELVPPAGVLGHITAEAARQTGIPEGLTLIAAAADKACEVIGAGCLYPHMACLSYGTTATINTTHKKYLEAIPLIPPFPAAVPHAYTLEIMIYRGYWMVSWFKQEFAHLEQMKARDQGIDPEMLFDDLVKQSPPGAMGLVLQPYWSPGLKVPGPEARGAIIGFGDVHNRAHVYRAILEGLAYALREGKERLERRSGIPITEVRVAGGGSQSDAAMQLTADIFGLPVGRPHVYDASGLGAAIDAAVGLGLYSDFAEAVSRMTRVGRIFEPDPHTQHIYDRLYHRVYKQMYQRLKPLYEEIRKITA
jgi:sugar (pentulose or hexulose) kinase